MSAFFWSLWPRSTAKLRGVSSRNLSFPRIHHPAPARRGAQFSLNKFDVLLLFLGGRVFRPLICLLKIHVICNLAVSHLVRMLKGRREQICRNPMESSNGKTANQIPVRSSWNYDTLSRCISVNRILHTWTWHNTLFGWLGGGVVRFFLHEGYILFWTWRVFSLVSCHQNHFSFLLFVTSFSWPSVVRNFRPTTADRFRGAKSPVEQGKWVELVDLGHFGLWIWVIFHFKCCSTATIFGMRQICWTQCRMEAHAPILASPPKKYFTKMTGLPVVIINHNSISIFHLLNISFGNFRILSGDSSVVSSCMMLYVCWHVLWTYDQE